MILAVDFDRVIHDRDNPVPGRRMGPPLNDAKPALETLHRRGHMIIVHTVMATDPSGQKAVTDWLQYYGIPFHEVTAIKPNADFYIDDKAIRHINWDNTIAEMGKLGPI